VVDWGWLCRGARANRDGVGKPRLDLKFCLAKWHLGELRWADAPRSGGIVVQGTRTLAQTLPTWHRDPQRGPQPLHRVNRPTPLHPRRRRGRTVQAVTPTAWRARASRNLGANLTYDDANV